MSIKYYDHANYAYELGRMMAGELLPTGFFDDITGDAAGAVGTEQGASARI